MNHPIPYILLAESDANLVAYILLIAGPLLAMVFFYFWQRRRNEHAVSYTHLTLPTKRIV